MFLTLHSGVLGWSACALLLLWASNGGYFVWMMSLITIMAPLLRLQRSDTEQRGCGCMTRSVEDKNTVIIITLSRKCDWLVEESAGDVTSAFMKNWEIFSWKCSERPHKKKAEHSENRHFLQTTSCYCRRSLLIENNWNNTLVLRKKTPGGHGP